MSKFKFGRLAASYARAHGRREWSDQFFDFKYCQIDPFQTDWAIKIAEMYEFYRGFEYQMQEYRRLGIEAMSEEAIDDIP